GGEAQTLQNQSDLCRQSAKSLHAPGQIDCRVVNRQESLGQRQDDFAELAAYFLALAGLRYCRRLLGDLDIAPTARLFILELLQRDDQLTPRLKALARILRQAGHHDLVERRRDRSSSTLAGTSGLAGKVPVDDLGRRSDERSLAGEKLVEDAADRVD